MWVKTSEQFINLRLVERVVFGALPDGTPDGRIALFVNGDLDPSVQLEGDDAATVLRLLEVLGSSSALLAARDDGNAYYGNTSGNVLGSSSALLAARGPVEAGPAPALPRG